MKILAISGSLRADSYNTATLDAARALAPEGIEVTVATLHGIPNFDADLETAEGNPPAVDELRAAIAAADALLIATPEYNFSIPGVLKNAIDWASRGGAESPLNDIPAAILGAGGRFGTLRAQLHLREILLHNRVRLVPAPQVMIDQASARFDSDRNLHEERFRKQLRALLDALSEEVHRSAG